MFHLVLVEPEIAPNTGNIARTCAATGCALHLVEPLGFSIDDKHLKRAGLDYWSRLEIYRHRNLEEFFAQHPDGPYYYLTTKATRAYTEEVFGEDAYFLFGRETRGLPEGLLRRNPERCLRIPMREGIRSLNLSNSAAVVVFEALRQTGFRGLLQAGRFPIEVE